MMTTLIPVSTLVHSLGFNGIEATFLCARDESLVLPACVSGSTACADHAAGPNTPRSHLDSGVKTSLFNQCSNMFNEYRV